MAAHAPTRPRARIRKVRRDGPSAVHESDALEEKRRMKKAHRERRPVLAPRRPQLLDEDLGTEKAIVHVEKPPVVLPAGTGDDVPELHMAAGMRVDDLHRRLRRLLRLGL